MTTVHMQVGYPAWKGWCFAIAASLSSGYFVISFHKLNQTAGHLPGLFITMFACLALYSTAALINRGGSMRFTRRAPILLVIITVTITGNLAAIISLDLLSPAILQVIQRSEILFTIFLGFIILREKIRPETYFAALLVIFGIILINYENTSFSLSGWSGILYAVASGASFAVLQVACKIMLVDFSPVMLNLTRMAATCIMLIVLFPGVISKLGELPNEAWLWGILSAFCGPFLGRLFYTYSIKYIEVSKAAVVTALSPIFSLILQWYILGQGITLLQSFGGALVIAAVCSLFYINQKRVGRQST